LGLCPVSVAVRDKERANIMTHENYTHQPFAHPSLGSIDIDWGDVWETAKAEGKAALARTTRAAASSETVRNYASSQADVLAQSVVDTIIDSIPNEIRMTEIGQNIALKLIQIMDENVLPKMFNASAQARSLGLALSDDALETLRLKIIDALPRNVEYNSMSIPFSPQDAIRNALTKQKFKVLYSKIQPLVKSTIETLEPAVKLKARQVLGFVGINSFLVGCAFMAGTIWLYQSCAHER